ncbi:hypothetical protein [Arthrobacter sp. MW3 TE3886]|uniref:hypothetical protein n=1 Tax=Arthrobacter sp. MW3 TE3886 TaxID=3156254 RepID=UPI003511E699
MEHSTSVLMSSAQTGVENNFLLETHLHSPLEVVHLLAPMARRRAVLRAQVSCAALLFAALAVAAAYILVPLAMAVHVAMHPVFLSVVIAAAILTEVALMVTFIILKTEGPEE